MGTTDLCSGNCWTRHFAKLCSGFISHSGLKIMWEISHEFEMRNIPRRNIPAAKSPPRLYCTRLVTASTRHSRPRAKGRTEQGHASPWATERAPCKLRNYQ